mgnify:FL=1
MAAVIVLSDQTICAGWLLLLQRMAKAKQCGHVGNTFDGKVDTDEVTHGLAVIDGIFERFVGQSVPLLQGNRPAPFALDRLVADRACPPI